MKQNTFHENLAAANGHAPFHASLVEPTGLTRLAWKGVLC